MRCMTAAHWDLFISIFAQLLAFEIQDKKTRRVLSSASLCPLVNIHSRQQDSAYSDGENMYLSPGHSGPSRNFNRNRKPPPRFLFPGKASTISAFRVLSSDSRWFQ
ncbi:hypothetical protein C8R45DRAFT_140691 [Mycena sanguinolenta]|nr:hypothetical protein C8R45DRAFT_140691 [Mycena sanguinolenta]